MKAQLKTELDGEKWSVAYASQGVTRHKRLYESWPSSGWYIHLVS